MRYCHIHYDAWVHLAAVLAAIGILAFSISQGNSSSEGSLGTFGIIIFLWLTRLQKSSLEHWWYHCLAGNTSLEEPIGHMGNPSSRTVEH